MAQRSNGPGWVAARTAALDRDKRCRRCGSQQNMHVHHIVARYDGGTNDLSNLITLCYNCHMEWHAFEAHPVGRSMWAAWLDSPPFPVLLRIWADEGFGHMTLDECRSMYLEAIVCFRVPGVQHG